MKESFRNLGPLSGWFLVILFNLSLTLSDLPIATKFWIGTAGWMFFVWYLSREDDSIKEAEDVVPLPSFPTFLLFGMVALLLRVSFHGSPGD